MGGGGGAIPGLSNEIYRDGLNPQLYRSMLHVPIFRSGITDTQLFYYTDISASNKCTAPITFLRCSAGG